MLPSLITVRVDEIKIPDWLCAFCSDFKLQMMKESIAKYGLVNYPICYKDDEGIHLIDGFARLKACGTEHIIVGCYNMTEIDAMKLFININSPDLLT